MAVLPSEFSEFAFGYTVTTKLVDFRVGTLSPWPNKFGRFEGVLVRRNLRKPHVAEKVKRLLMKFFDLDAKQALAVIDAYGAPFIPTQSFEKRFPVDVAMNSNGVYLFLQYKRSTAVTTKHGRLKEMQQIRDGDLILPFYRVDIGGGKVGKNGKSAGFEQWYNLGKLEDKLRGVKSAFVGYAAPAFHTLSELSELHRDGLSADIDGRNPVVFFEATKLKIPDNKRHWVSFDGTDIKVKWRYSSEPVGFRSAVSLAEVFGERLQNAPSLSQSIKELRPLLDEYAEKMDLDDQKKDDVPKELSSRAFLSMFGISISTKDGDIDPRDIEKRESEEFKRTTQTGDDPEFVLAEALKKIVTHSECGSDKRDESRLSFLEDLYHADYRCRNILGYPLMVGANLE